MMDIVKENLLYIVPAAVAVVLYVIWEIANGVRSRRGRRPVRAPAGPKPARWWQFRRRRAERAKPKDEDEFHADAAAQMTRRLEEQAREAQTRHEQRLAEINRTIEKARRLVTDSGIGVAAVDLLATMWNWPVEARARDWSRPAGLHELEYRPPRDAGEEGNGAIKVLTWLWDGSPYRLELEPAQEGEAADAPVKGSLTLFVDDDTVLALEVHKPDAGREDLWAVDDVMVLQAGQWMAEFAALAGRLRMAEEEKRRQMEFERLGAKAARIDLGDFDEDQKDVEEEGAGRR